jgi:hypothetical protein
MLLVRSWWSGAGGIELSIITDINRQKFTCNSTDVDGKAPYHLALTIHALWPSSIVWRGSYCPGMALLSKPIDFSRLKSSKTPTVVLLAACLLLRLRLLSIPREALAALKSATLGNKLSPEQLLEVLQQLYVKEANGSKTLLVPYLDRISKVWSILGPI